jgi:short-subunit dehydrogenase
MALDAISDAARLELQEDNIRIMTVYPGLTSTNFFRHSLGSTNTSDTAPRGILADTVAKRIVLSVRKEPRVLYMGCSAQLRGIFAQLFPFAAEKITALKKQYRRGSPATQPTG